MLHEEGVRQLEMTAGKLLRVLHALAVVVAFPVPEKRHDLADVRAAGDVLERFVIDADRGGALVGFAVRVGDPHGKRGLLAGLELVLRGRDLDVEHALFRRQNDLPRDRVHFTVGYRHALDEEVRHVAESDRDLDELRLALDADDFRLRQFPLRGSDEKPDSRVRLVHVDQQFHGVAGAVFLLVGDEFKGVVAEITFGLRAAHGEHRRALLFAAFLVRENDGHAILPGLRRGERPVPSLGRPFSDLLLLDLTLRVESRRIEDGGRRALDLFPVQRAGGEGAGDLVADVRIAAVEPNGHAERLAGGEHGAVADDGAARGIYYLRSN